MSAEKKTLKQLWAEAEADSARRAEQKRAKRAEKQAVEQASLKASCFFHGSTRAVDNLKGGMAYGFRIDPAGISIRSWVLAQELLRIDWRSVVDIDVDDASQTHVKSRVEQRASGGLWSPLGTTAPVSRTSSVREVRCDVDIRTTDGDWLFSVHADRAVLRGKLLGSRHLRAKPTPRLGSTAPSENPGTRLAQLAELHAAGLITDEDLLATKADILREL